MKIEIKDIDLIVYDFDGVMTDNRVLVLEDGREGVFCNRSDGLAISILKEKKIPQLIFSTETNKVVSSRAKKLDIPALQSIGDKLSALILYCKENNYDLNKVIFIGNDINDADVMRAVGYPFCPEDAVSVISDISKDVIPCKGGFGVIRSFMENNLEILS